MFFKYTSKKMFPSQTRKNKTKNNNTRKNREPKTTTDWFTELFLEFTVQINKQQIALACELLEHIHPNDLRQVFHHVCVTGNVYMVNYIIDKFPNNRLFLKNTFSETCLNGHLEVVKILDEEMEEEIVVNYSVPILFYRMCTTSEHLDVIKYLGVVGYEFESEFAFYCACKNRKTIEIAKWIYSTYKIDLSWRNYLIITKMLSQKRYELVEWLVSLHPTKFHVMRKHDNICDIIILDNSDVIVKDIVKTDDNDSSCMVCYERGNLRTDCGHVFCNECVTKWNKKNSSCPCCRHLVEHYDYLHVNHETINGLQKYTGKNNFMRLHGDGSLSIFDGNRNREIQL